MYNPAEFNGNCRFGRKAPQNQWSEMTMRFFICATVAILVALTTVGKAFAEAAEGQSYFSVMGSYIDDDDDRGIEDGINGGQFAFGYAFHEFWNAEALFQVGRGEGNVTPNDPTHNYNGIGIDLQRVFRRDERFSPYLHAGLGYFMDDPSGADSDDGSMYSAGVGFYYDLFSTNLALRGEWRFRTDSAAEGQEPWLRGGGRRRGIGHVGQRHRRRQWLRLCGAMTGVSGAGFVVAARAHLAFAGAPVRWQHNTTTQQHTRRDTGSRSVAERGGQRSASGGDE
jgi:hypothetical protein